MPHKKVDMLLYHTFRKIHIDTIDFYMDKFDFYKKIRFFSRNLLTNRGRSGIIMPTKKVG